MELSTCLGNNATSLQLPIQNNPVAISGYGSAVGVSIQIGNPPQFFSSKPAFTENNIWVTDADFCEPTNYTCIAYYGGVYTPPEDVRMTSTMDDWNGTYSESSHLRMFFFNDDIEIGGRKIPGMPFYTYYYEAGGCKCHADCRCSTYTS